MKKIAALVVGAVLIPALLMQGSAVGTGEHPAARSTTYRVKAGALFNLPNTAPLTIQNRIISVLDHVHRHGQIRAMTWNFNAPAITNALLRAHHRGATVRLIMARTLVGPEFRRLKSGLRWHNVARDPKWRSWARTCDHSCRGRGGSEHSKWVTVSQSGATKQVIMEGSFNLTTSAVRMQWNDWYTITGDQKLYSGYQKVFNQAAHDRPVAPYMVHSRFRTGWFAPRSGRTDVVLNMLNKVHCGGAWSGSGINGHTVVRVASAVIQQARGEAIARRLRYLSRHGCNVRVLYTLSTHTVLGYLKGVPTKHMAWDTNGDGLFDRYLHMKAMTISGHYGTNHKAHMMFNGSANWSKMGVVSDEQGFIVARRSIERRYTKHINYLWSHTSSARKVPSRQVMRANGVTDPYAAIRKDLMD